MRGEGRGTRKRAKGGCTRYAHYFDSFLFCLLTFLHSATSTTCPPASYGLPRALDHFPRQHAHLEPENTPTWPCFLYSAAILTCFVSGHSPIRLSKPGNRRGLKTGRGAHTWVRHPLFHFSLFLSYSTSILRMPNKHRGLGRQERRYAPFFLRFSPLHLLSTSIPRCTKTSTHGRFFSFGVCSLAPSP